jgi:hypothetical protein
MTSAHHTSLIRWSQLSRPRQTLVRLFQRIDYGQVIDLYVSHGEPQLDPSPRIVCEIKLDGENESRPELALPDFQLTQEVLQLFSRMEKLGSGFVQRIEVRAGIPRRILIEMPLARDMTAGSSR